MILFYSHYSAACASRCRTVVGHILNGSALRWSRCFAAELQVQEMNKTASVSGGVTLGTGRVVVRVVVGRGGECQSPYPLVN